MSIHRDPSQTTEQPDLHDIAEPPLEAVAAEPEAGAPPEPEPALPGPPEAPPDYHDQQLPIVERPSPTRTTMREKIETKRRADAEKERKIAEEEAAAMDQRLTLKWDEKNKQRVIKANQDRDERDQKDGTPEERRIKKEREAEQFLLNFRKIDRKRAIEEQSIIDAKEEHDRGMDLIKSIRQRKKEE